jgi:hypothetical protein
VSGAIHFCSLNLQASTINSREWIAEDLFADGQRLLRAGAGPFTRRLGEERLSFPSLRGLSAARPSEQTTP